MRQTAPEPTGDARYANKAPSEVRATPTVKKTKVKTKSDAESTRSSSLEAETEPKRRAMTMTPPTVVTKTS